MPPARILIVEDEDLLAQNLKTYLGRRTPDVRVAPDAEQAMRILESFTPDVVVLDYALPGIDGLHAYRNMVGKGNGAPGCVMITGHMTDHLAECAHQQGIQYMLGKPFSLAELQQMVDSLAEHAANPAPAASNDAGTTATPLDPVSSSDRRHIDRRHQADRRSH